MRTILVVIVVGFALTPTGMTSVLMLQAQAGKAPMAVGIVDDDNHLLPIARFAGTEWVNTWPQPEDAGAPVPPLSKVPEQWLGGRVPRQWTVWLTSGASAPVSVTGIDRSGGCVVSPSLTIAPINVPPGLIDPVPLGIAVAGGLTAQAVRPITAKDADWPTIQSVLAQVYPGHERQALAEYDGDWKDHIRRDRIGAVKPDLAALFGHTDADGPRTYLFQMNKEIHREGEERLRVTVSGWLVGDAAGALRAVDVYGSVDRGSIAPPGDSVDVLQRVPLGIVRAGGDATWVVEEPSGETSTFILERVDPSGVYRLLVVSGGGC